MEIGGGLGGGNRSELGGTGHSRVEAAQSAVFVFRAITGKVKGIRSFLAEPWRDINGWVGTVGARHNSGMIHRTFLREGKGLRV